MKTQPNSSPELLRKLYRDKDRSESFIEQCVLSGNIVLQLKEAAHKSKEEGESELSYQVATAMDIANPEYRFNFFSEIKSDLLLKKLSKKKTSGRTKSTFFLFIIFPPTLPKHSVRKRIKDVINLYSGYEWDGVEDLPFPTTMIVCPTISTLIYAKRLTKKLLEEEDNPDDLHFQFTTAEKLKDHGVSNKIWEAV